MNITEFLETHFLVYLKVSTWSASRNNKPKDLGIDAEIASECASLGGKSVFDKKKLKFMTQNRNEALLLLNKYGFPCMGGFAILHNFKDAVIEELTRIKESNEHSLDRLLSDYEAECEQWIQVAAKKVSIPGFADAIRSSLYTESYVRNQVRFEFTVSENLADDPVGDAALNTVAELAAQSLKNFQRSMEGGANFTRKSFSYLMKVKEKLVQLSMLDSFVEPAITQIEKFEEEWNAISSRPRKENGKTTQKIDPSLMSMLMGELSLLSNPTYLASLRKATFTIEADENDEPVEKVGSSQQEPDDFLAGLLAITSTSVSEEEAPANFY